MKQLINSIAADIIDYFYGYMYIILVSSELHRFQKGPNHPEREYKLIPEEHSAIPEVGQQTESTLEVGPEGYQ